MLKQFLIRSIFLIFINALFSPSYSFATPTKERINQPHDKEISIDKKQNIFRKIKMRLAQIRADKVIKKPKSEDSGRLAFILGIASPLLLILALLIGIYFLSAIALAFAILFCSVIVGALALHVGIRTLRYNKQNNIKKGTKTAIVGIVFGGIMSLLYLFYLRVLLF